jgi:DNA polymerase
MSKKEKYLALVKKRKEFKFSNNLVNPANTKFDLNDIEPWAQWQNNLDADLLLIGQEFCDITTFIKCQGKVEQFETRYEYPSNQNLHNLFASIGIEIGHPLKPNKKAKVFFTNAVMGLKPGSMSSNFKDKWLKESRDHFLIPLIDLLQPNIIITVGSKAYLSVSKIYNYKTQSLKQQIKENPIVIENGPTIYHFYHPGKLGVIMRNHELQLEDWKGIMLSK